MVKINILVTNDDGDSPGLRALVEVAKRVRLRSRNSEPKTPNAGNEYDEINQSDRRDSTQFGNEVFAIAPNRQRSAVSGALTLHKPIRMHRILEGHGKLKPKNNCYTINGTPSDCVLFGIYSEQFWKPDLVLSGINWGDNTSLGSLIGSGTVGACWQAAVQRIPSIAISLCKSPGKDWRDNESWGDIDKLTEKVGEIIEKILPKTSKSSFFNVNIPYDFHGSKIVYAKRIQNERWRTKVEKRLDPDGVPYFWISGATNRIDKGTDVEDLVIKKNISITEISLDTLVGFVGKGNKE